MIPGSGVASAPELRHLGDLGVLGGGEAVCLVHLTVLNSLLFKY